MGEERREKLKALGRELQSKREELGLSLEDVAQATKIRRVYLEAVEAGDDSIPVGKAYFRAFVKSYAGFLGLDPMEYSRRYGQIALEDSGKSQEQTRSSEPVRPGQPEAPVDEEKVPGGSHGARRKLGRAGLVGSKKKIHILLLCAVLLVAAAMVAARNSGLFVGTPASRSEPGGVSSPPPPGGGVAPSGGSSGQGGQGGQTGQTGKAETGAPAEPEGEPELEITKEKIDQETIGFTVKADSLTVVVKTLPVEDGRCWVRATCDGQVVFEATLEPGSEKKFEASQEISLRLGRPWVVNLSVNGKDLGQAGPFGPVLNIVFKTKGPS
ncbi:MAG TPA: DUF4115 domain-containing protein [Firmicutes bacterium]|nr:DUF4115 domain-containing protein [Candidatus Fermentithermobacillaceae bacterium]